jgi:hypothetical protein
VRKRSVIELAERCSYWPEHAHQNRAPGGLDFRSDPRGARPRRSGARMAGVCLRCCTTSAPTSAIRGITSTRTTW